MKQRIFLAKTLIPDPPVLMLDEPASGLDPLARQEFTQLLKTLAQEGKSIILSSHILEELNTVCDSLCVMVKGKLIDFGRVEEVRGRLKPNLAIDLSFKPKEAIQIETYFRTQLFPKYPLLQLIESRTHTGFKEAQHFCLEIKLDAEETDYPQFLNQLLNELAQSNLGLFHFNLQEANLQDLFLHLSKGVD
jgi:ABC-2 type transport system ATP-binding protein